VPALPLGSSLRRLPVRPPWTARLRRHRGAPRGALRGVPRGLAAAWHSEEPVSSSAQLDVTKHFWWPVQVMTPQEVAAEADQSRRRRSRFARTVALRLDSSRHRRVPRRSLRDPDERVLPRRLSPGQRSQAHRPGNAPLDSS